MQDNQMRDVTSLRLNLIGGLRTTFETVNLF